MLTRLIWVNAAVFLLLLTLDLINDWGDGVIAQWIPDEGAWTLGTYWKIEILRMRPWSVLTHMFAHMDPWHFAMNMLLLFWMGRVYQAEVGSRRLLSTYVAGGLAGFVAYLLLTHGIEPLQELEQEVQEGIFKPKYALGASAAVMAILEPLRRLPGMKFNLLLFGPVALKHLFWGYVALDYFWLSQGVNAGGNVAHLGGAVFGVLLVHQDQRPQLMLVGVVAGCAYFRHIAILSARKSVQCIDIQSLEGEEREASRAPMSDDEFNAARAEREEKLDAILDKISRHGYVICRQRKRFLFEQSQR